MKKGAIVKVCIIAIPTSKRNIDRKCDPDTAWTKKASVRAKA